MVDTAAAKAAGVTVTNIPAYSTQAVAQMAMALLLEIALHVGDHSASVHRGDWVKSPSFTYWKHPLFELAGKRMGIYGFGQTGQATAKAAAGLGMEVVVADAHEMCIRDGYSTVAVVKIALTQVTGKWNREQ